MSKRTTTNGFETLHVIPLGKGWVVKSASSEKPIEKRDTKTEAISAARKLAKTKDTDIIVYGRSGSFKLSRSDADAAMLRAVSGLL